MQKQMKESNKKNSCVFVYIRIPLFRNKEKLNFYIFHPSIKFVPSGSNSF